MMHEDIAFAQSPEQIGRARGLDFGDMGMGAGDERLVLELGPVEVGDLVEAAQVEGALQVEHLVGGDVELGGEELEDLRGHRWLDLEAYGRTELASQQLLLEGLQQVLGIVLLDLEVLVAGHPEGVVRDDLHSGEQQVEMGGNDLFERDEATGGGGHPAIDDGRHLDPGEAFLACLGVAHDEREVE